MNTMTTPEKLIRAAEAELIANNGQLEMSGVAKRAKLSVGLAYHHFGSKAGLIAAVIDAFYEPLNEIMFGEVISLDESWPERERARTRAFVDYYLTHPFAALVVGRLGREPQVMDMEARHMAALLDTGAKNIRAGQRDGVIAAAIDPEVAIAMTLGGLKEAVRIALLQESITDVDTLSAHCWAFIQSGLGIEPSNTGA